MNKKVLIFDCDGTVLDTFELIEHIVLDTFKHLVPNYNISLEEAHSFFGPFINDTFKKYEYLGVSVDEYISYYGLLAEKYTKKYIKPYEGIKEAFIKLHEMGFDIAIISNKISLEVYRGLKICGIDNLVDHVIGAECVKHAKPDPEGINNLLKMYNTTNSIMVGDMEADILAGKNAHIYTCGVTWCKTKKEDFIKYGADFIIDHPLDLIKIGETYGRDF